jgi:hypothetical protein
MEAASQLVSLLRVMGISINAGPVGSEAFVTPVAGLEGLFMLIAMVAFAFWIYRANANLHAFGVNDIYSPGWAVGNYFIPVASLWLGYRVMEEVWNKSGPPDSALDGKGWLLPVWSSGWIATNLLPTVQSVFKGSFDLTTRAVLQFGEPFANVIAGAALTAIIGMIDVAQHQQESFEVF